MAAWVVLPLAAPGDVTYSEKWVGLTLGFTRKGESSTWHGRASQSTSLLTASV